MAEGLTGDLPRRSGRDLSSELEASARSTGAGGGLACCETQAWRLDWRGRAHDEVTLERLERCRVRRLVRWLVVAEGEQVGRRGRRRQGGRSGRVLLQLGRQPARAQKQTRDDRQRRRGGNRGVSELPVRSRDRAVDRSKKEGREDATSSTSLPVGATVDPSLDERLNLPDDLSCRLAPPSYERGEKVHGPLSDEGGPTFLLSLTVLPPAERASEGGQARRANVVRGEGRVQFSHRQVRQGNERGRLRLAICVVRARQTSRGGCWELRTRRELDHSFTAPLTKDEA